MKTLSVEFCLNVATNVSDINVLTKREEPDEFFCLSYQGTQRVAAGPEPSGSGLCVGWLTVQCREDYVRRRLSSS